MLRARAEILNEGHVEDQVVLAVQRGEAVEIEFDTFILRIKGKAVELQDVQWGTL